MRALHAGIFAAAILLSAPYGFAALAADGAQQPPGDAVWPTKTWQVSTPEEEGMDSASLARLVETVGLSRQDSLVIVRHGRIVTEAYYAPFVGGIAHDLRSVTKSIVGTLTAIEVQKGLLDSVDRPVADLFGDKPIDNLDDRKKAITVQHLLDMTSGIAWEERNYTPNETVMRMYQAPDHTRFVLDQPMSETPGTKFYYNSGNPYVLSALINKRTGSDALAFATKELFEPLGIGSARWGKPDAQGVIDGEATLNLSPRDMAKIGYLYLREGVWQGRRLISAEWVRRARQGPVSATFGMHYANLWWSLPEKDAYMALGRHSQLILVLPKLDIVAAMTGALRDGENFPTRLLIDDIAAAVKSDAALPPDPVASALLADAIRLAAKGTPAAVGGVPEIAKTISGRVYRFAPNKLRAKTLTLNFYDTDASWEITTEPAVAGRPPPRFSGLMGLDGYYRKSPPAFYGINAARGRWRNAHTFELDRRVLGHSETQLWTLQFDGDGDGVDVHYENTDGFTAELHGRSEN